MEKRFLFAILICSVILMVYPRYMKMLMPPQEQGESSDQTPLPTTDASEHATPVISADEEHIIQNIKGEKTFTLENEELRVTFSNIGGSVTSIVLKNYLDKETGECISFVSEEDELKSFGLSLSKGKFNCNDFLFNVVNETEHALVFSLNQGEVEIRRTYTMVPESFILGANVQIINHSTEKSYVAEYDISADANVAFESGYEKRFVKFSVLDGDKIHSALFDKVRTKGALFEGANQWMALRKKYFSIFVKPSFAMEHARAQVIKGTIFRGTIKAPKREIAPGERLSDDLDVYCGPTQMDILKSYNMGFEKVSSGGFWGLFRMTLLTMLGFFYKVFHNYGLAIIALTITIKIAFIPLTHKSFSSMKKMQELQPKMKALQEQFKSEPQKLNKEVMALYKKHKVNPLGGCFPLLLQMPIFIALYQVLSEAVELRGAPFCLWIRDLSSADQLIQFPFTIPLVNISSLNLLPILMMFSMIWQQKLTGSTAQSKDQQNMMMMMPIVFVFIFYNLPSGLVLYWLLNNVLTIAQQLLSHKFHPTTPVTE